MRTCTRCLAAKPEDEFPTEKRRPGGRGYACRDCVNKARRQKYKRDKSAKAVSKSFEEIGKTAESAAD